MMVKIMYFMILVSNQDTSLEFYTKLGFEKRVDYPGPEGRFLTISFKGQDVEIILWKGNPVQSVDNSNVSISANPGILFIESKDLKKDFGILLSKGVQFVEKEPEGPTEGYHPAATMRQCLQSVRPQGSAAQGANYPAQRSESYLHRHTPCP